jgi:hypothetical protein
MISNLIDIGENNSIQTSSFIVNQSKTNLTETPLNISFQDGSSLALPSFCNLTKKFCSSSKFINIKVKIN